MEDAIVWIIVVLALVFTVRSIVKIYQGDGGCACAGGCSGCPDSKKDKNDCGCTDFLKK